MKPNRAKRTRLRSKARPKGPELSQEAIKDISEIVGHSFKDIALLTRAFTHPSALQPNDTGLSSNQRLEFLGDRVLGLVIAERLFTRRKTEREGALAPRLNRLVNKRACAQAARHLGLGKYVLMSSYEIAQGGQDRDTTLGDLCESVIAAIYLDSGLTMARAFIEKAFAPQLTAQPSRLKDPKSLLQEWAQAHGRPLPRYRILKRSGPDHAPSFVVEVSIGDDLTQSANETSKQNAERAAAQKLLSIVAPAENDL
ncbi:MAG: ribonuclease III [Pseudomonadota bacterium]